MSVVKGQNEYHVTAFDPGAAGTGWCHFVVDCRAFSRPENKVLRWLKSWESGVLRGSEVEHMAAATGMISDTTSIHGRNANYMLYDVVSEDFDLVQTVGSKQNLLSPVRINAVLAWHCHNRAVKFHLQNRALRSSITRERLKLFGFDKRWQKDEFAAMQHGVYWLRHIKKLSRQRPWKLSDGAVLNAYWDCACADDEPCDMLHPGERITRVRTP